METETSTLNLSGAKVVSGKGDGLGIGKFKSVPNPTNEVIDEQPQNTTEDVQEQEQGNEQAENQEQGSQAQEQKEVLELSDEQVLAYLKEKKGFNKDELSFEESKGDLEIPEQVQKFLDYQKETGRGFEDFVELQKDWTKEDESVVLKKFLKEKNPYYTDEDIEDELSEFSYDEDLDDESDIKKINRKKKKLLNEALSYLESQKEKYKAPTEGSSVTSEIPEDYKLAKEKLQEIERVNQDSQALAQQKAQKFLEETNKIFNDEFKGFEFDLGEKVVSFKPAEVKDLINAQSDINNFLAKFVDDKGELVDVKGYHKALSGAMNVDKLAKHFYEQGKADAIADDAKDSKNINFSGRRVPDTNTPKKGLRAVETNQNSKFGFKK